MNDNFKQTFESFKKEQEDLNRRMADARREAIQHVQEIIDVFGIKPSDLRFPIEGVAIHRTRAPSPIKYRTPNGITWTGKGRMKKELAEYLEERGETIADLHKYLVSTPVQTEEPKTDTAEEPKDEPQQEEPKEEAKTGTKEEKRKVRSLFHKAEE